MLQSTLDLGTNELIQQFETRPNPEEYVTIIKDRDCTKDTPVIYGFKPEAIYGKNMSIKPRVPSRRDSNGQIKKYLAELDPLETYDKIVIFKSGGKDSLAAFLHLLELGVPVKKIEFWHHDIDGQHPTHKMDWPVTKNYCKALAQAYGIPLRISFRENGFWGEVFREGSSYPIHFENTEGEWQTTYPVAWKRTVELKEIIKQAELDDNLDEMKNAIQELHTIGKRLKFPAKSPNLQVRWCSSLLKIEVGMAIIAYQESTKKNCKILVVSGERRAESTNRSNYNEIELHKTNAQIRNKRIIHQWRPVLDFSERDVWEVIKRNKVNPHPCYQAGWNRASCAMCIFSSPQHWQGIKELMPEAYEQIRQAEIDLNFTLDNNKPLNEFVGTVKSCVNWKDKKAIEQLTTGIFTVDDIFVEEWQFPSGSFHGSDGGPC